MHFMWHQGQNIVWRVFCTLLLGLCKIADSAVTESDLFPFLESSGSIQFPFDDDDFTNIKLKISFPFLGTSYSTLYINGNGIITFGGGSNAYNYNCKANEPNHPTVAVFMADAHYNRGGGNTKAKLLYRQDTNITSLEKVSADVFTAFPALNGTKLKWMLIVTWYNIPPYALEYAHLRNTFQAVLTTDGVKSFVLFYFNNITWPLAKWLPSSVNRWKPAELGIYGGKNSTQNTFILSGSCNYSLTDDITELSNICSPGKFVFRVDNDVVLPSVFPCTPRTSKVHESLIQFKPAAVPLIGSVPVAPHNDNLCMLNNLTKATCTFIISSVDVPFQVEAVKIPYKLAVVCQTPTFYTLGRLQVKVSLIFENGETYNSSGYIYLNKLPGYTLWTLGKINVMLEVSFLEHPTTILEGYFWVDKIEDRDINKLTISATDPLKLYWNVTGLQTDKMKNELCEIGLLRVQQKNTFTPLWSLKCNSTNFERDFLAFKNSQNLSAREMFSSQTLFVLRGPRSEVLAAADPLSSILALHHAVTKVQSRQLFDMFDELCIEWHEHSKSPSISYDILACPRILKQAEVDWRFTLGKNWKTIVSLFGDQDLKVFSQSVPSKSGSGSLCVYDMSGMLLHGPPTGSVIHQFSPNGRHNYWSHFTNDILPYLHCCKWNINSEENCQKYFYEKRAMSIIGKYTPPKFAIISGKSLMQTFNGVRYSLKGQGFGGLVKYANRKWSDLEKFKSQAKFEMSSEKNVTSLTALAMQQSVGNSEVNIQISRKATSSEGFIVHVDGYLLKERDLKTAYLDGASIFFNEAVSEVLVVFQLGFTFKFRIDGDSAMTVIFSTSANLLDKSVGLLTGIQQSVKLQKEELVFSDVQNKFTNKDSVEFDLSNAKSGILEGVIGASNTVVLECPPPEEIEGGRVTIRSLAVGSRLQISCDDEDGSVVEYNYKCIAMENKAIWEMVGELAYNILSTLSCNDDFDGDDNGEDIWSTFRRPEYRSE